MTIKNKHYAILIVTLGCAKNTVQSQVIAGLLEGAGHSLVEDAKEADLVIVNTCGFITAAKEESIATILEAGRLKEEGTLQKLIVMGCMVQKYADELAESLPEVDLWLGTSHHQDLITMIDKIDHISGQTLVGTSWTLPKSESYLGRKRDHDLPYAYLTIAEGCDNSCSFCAIPEMTGSYRSRRMEDILEEAEHLVGQGVKEIILIAQDTTYYGKDLYGDFALGSLLRSLAKLKELKWIRILYAYPNNFTEDMIAAIAEEEKVCAYLDIPIQHGDNHILQAMGRKISVQEIENLICRLRSSIPGLVLRSTFITGFPGEEEEAFTHLLDFLKRNRLDRVGVFPYSQEEGTPAGRREDQVPLEIREERAQSLMALQTDIMQEIHQGRIGQEIQVLVDEPSQDDDNLYFCRSYGEAPEVDPLILVWTDRDDLRIGDFITVRIKDVLDYDLVGEIIHESA